MPPHIIFFGSVSMLSTVNPVEFDSEAFLPIFNSLKLVHKETRPKSDAKPSNMETAACCHTQITPLVLKFGECKTEHNTECMKRKCPHFGMHLAPNKAV